VIWGQKLTLNHPSLVDEGEKKLGFQLTAHKREGGRERRENQILINVLKIEIFDFFFSFFLNP